MKTQKLKTYTIGSLQIKAISLEDAQAKARIISQFNNQMNFQL